MSKFKKGDRVIYSKNNINKVVVIQAVHFDNAPDIYYTIIDSNKLEKQTMEKYLIRKLSPYTVFDNQLPKILVAIHMHSSEINNKRFEKFIRANHKQLQETDNIFLFINKSSETERIRNICNKLNISIIELDETGLDAGINNLANTFFNLVTYQLQNYKYLLRLETDCRLSNNWYSTLQNDMKNRKFWMYGSTSTVCIEDYDNLHYNITDTNPKPIKVNGVAIYNRTPEFIDLIYENINICLSSSYRYDLLLSNIIFNKNPKMLLDSPYICDISANSQRYFHYTNFKPYARVLHQKF